MVEKRTPTPHGAESQPRRTRRIHEETPGKRAELAVCPECGASYREGRWTWKPAPAGSYAQECPACERIRSDYPAGSVEVEGGFVAEHREEITGLVRHVEEREREHHPLKRIMAIEDSDTGFLVKTTDGKLAESIGRALHKAYSGELEQPPTTADVENLVRVRWTRD